MLGGKLRDRPGIRRLDHPQRPRDRAGGIRDRAPGADGPVVDRQDTPPSRRPVAYVVPFDAVDSARTQRVNDADPALDEILINEIMNEFATPTAP